MPDEQITRGSTNQYAGRLVAIPGQNDVLQQYDRTDPTSTNVLSNATFIEFPSHPDVIQLRRVAKYLAYTNQYLPDGIHQYLGTEPLVIEYSFRLHSADSTYCKNGPLTLLLVAARLHAFVLPINPTNKQVEVAVKFGSDYKNDSSQQQYQSNSNTISLSNPVGANLIRAPVVVQLELMDIGSGQPGIVCKGYVREVDVKFNGPYMRGAGSVYNLPTSADYAFTFVHLPGHSNATDLIPQGINANVLHPQAYANDVKTSLYNTRDLVKLASYQGINDPPNSSSTTPPIVEKSTSIPPDNRSVLDRIIDAPDPNEED